MIRRPTERSLALATNFFSINGKTEMQMVLQKGNVGRLFLWDKHRIIHNFFLVKVFVPMANSFQMIKHDSKPIQLKRLLSIWDIHSQSRNTFRDGHYFTELNHGSKQLYIKESFELHYRIGEMQFFRIYPFWRLKPTLRDISWAYFLHVFIALANFGSSTQINEPSNTLEQFCLALD